MTSMGDISGGASELRQQAAPVVVAIDDDTSFLLAATKALASAGMICHTATTGAAGLRLIRNYTPDLVLLDTLLISEDGFTVCREIRRTWSSEELPVIMVTGLEDLESIKAAYESGANDFLAKPLHWKHLPFRILHLLQASRDAIEHKRTEEALRISEEKFTKIFQMSPDAIDFVRTTDRVSLDFNHAFTNLFGYKPEDFIGKPVLPADRDLWVNKEDRHRLMTNLKEHGQVLGFEAPLRRKDGSTFIAEITCSALEIDGEPYHLSITRDITERKRAEEELRRSENSLKQQNTVLSALLHTLPIGVFMVEVPSGKPLVVNGVACDLLGRGLLSEVSKENLSEVHRSYKIGTHDPYPLEEMPIILGMSGKSSHVEDMLVERPDGTESILEVFGSPVMDDHGQVWASLVCFTNITERKRMLEALRESEERFRGLLESVDSVGIQGYDPDGITCYWNKASERLYGYTSEEAIGRNLLDLIIPPEMRGNVEQAMRNMLETGQTIPSSELLLLRKDGSRVAVYSSHAAVHVPGRPSEIFCMDIDLTERKHLEAQLQQAQKMEGLGSLAGGVAHDMNNVLGAILGMASANIATQSMGSPAYHAFDTISQAAVRGGKMVKSLLNFARQSPAEEQELDMNAILREEVSLLERTTLAKIRLEVELASELQPILGDASALTHAFMNLCVNAVDAMPENGSLILRTRNVDNDWIEVLVEDTGTGMSKEVLEKAMDPFFTTKEVGKGTGLGLSMVYSTVKAHHGQIEIRSEPGHGTRVRMRFPTCEPMVSHSEPDVEPQAASADWKLNVLVVDDDELIQSTMQAVLGVLCHTVVTTSSGEEALVKLEAGLQPDLVILDMNMPGLGGTGTLPRLRALHPNLPVLLATGRADQAALDLIAAYPYVTLLSKPFSMKELQQHIERLGVSVHP